MRLKYIKKKLTLGADKKIFFRGVSVSNSVSLWALLRLRERKKIIKKINTPFKVNFAVTKS